MMTMRLQGYGQDLLHVNLTDLDDEQLTQLWARVMTELRARDIVRTFNNRAGDIAEALAAQHLGLSVVDANSVKGYDATDVQGRRYQIKARRITSSNKSRQLGTIRDLDAEFFDFLVAVIFDEALSLREMCVMPPEVVRDYARWSSRTKSYLLRLQGEVLRDPRLSQVYPQA